MREREKTGDGRCEEGRQRERGEKKDALESLDFGTEAIRSS